MPATQPPKDSPDAAVQPQAQLAHAPELPSSSRAFVATTGFGSFSAGVRNHAGVGSAFDVCHVGMVLRALIFVHAAVGVGVGFAATDLKHWLGLLAVAASQVLPGVLLWLVLACLLKRRLALLAPVWQWTFAMLLGALSGVFGWALQAAGSLGLTASSSWVPSAVAGVALAGVLFYWLTLRAKAHMPADTTARLAELQSRIRPHFLFNTLNTAITLARLDPARTESLLEDLAELFRVALTDNGEPVSLADEVLLAQRYLAIEQVRFGERLRVTWELDPEAGAARVPALLLQPLVENAVRHGVEPSDEGGAVRIRTRVRHGQAHVTIVNTMPRQASRPGNGIALRNVRDRLRLMHDVASQFETRCDREFFRVQIVVPL